MFKAGKTRQEKARKAPESKGKFSAILCGMLVIMLALVISLTSCASTPPPSAPPSTPPSTNPTFENATVNEAQQLIIEEDDITILDVRTQQEYDFGHIPNATLIPVDELDDRLGELNETKAILVYCRTGVRSAQASQTLTDNGFSTVYNLEGGIVAWEKAGAPINHLPIIEDLVVTPEEPQFFKETNIIWKGKSCSIECIASDPDNDELSYEWSADAGSIAGEGLTVTWTAPLEAPLEGGKAIVTVTVADNSGGIATENIIFTVKECVCYFKSR